MSGLTRSGFLLSLLLIASGRVHQQVGHSHSHDPNDIYNPIHSHASHHGIVVPLFSEEQQVGFVELKLHDDKGDLELWVTKDEGGSQPLDLSLKTEVAVAFPELGSKAITLRVRNSEQNEDEDGKSNIRDNGTNYFIFPGETGADATFLMGKEFATETEVSFVVDGTSFTTGSFVLRPHAH